MMNKLRNIHIKRYTRFINSVASHLSEKESVIGPSATIAFPKFAKADSPRSSTHAADWDNDRESIHENISIDKPDLNSAGWFFRELHKLVHCES